MSEAPARKQLKNTMYDQMVFAPYEYREFPMAVPVVDGKVQDTPYDKKHKPHPVVIVTCQEELDALTGGEEVTLVPMDEADPAGAQRVESEDDIRAALYNQAEQAGVKFDKRWSVARIEDALKAHAASKDVV